MAELTKQELKFLTAIHLQGYVGKTGSLTQKQRLAILQSLIKKGMLNEMAQPTQKGIGEVNKEHDRFYNNKTKIKRKSIWAELGIKF